MNTEGELFRFITNKLWVPNWKRVFVSGYSRVRDGRAKGVHTNVDSQAPDGWKEDFDIWAGNEFGVHSSGVLEKSPAQ